MILDVMAFLLAISVLTSVAALLGEAGLRRLGLPLRWLWLGAMAAGPLLLLREALPPAGILPAAANLSSLPVLELPGIALRPEASAALGVLVSAVAALWLVASLAVLLLLARSARSLRGERRDWERSMVLGRSVLISKDRGPAVGGMRRRWIVLPGWVLSLPEPQLRMVLTHEEEHLRAGDPLLLLAALAFVVAAPWNPLAWWQLRRFRTAVELDCDRRVLRRAPDRRTYAESLLSVSARLTGPSLGLAAFGERSLSLQRRILAMTPHFSPSSRAVGAVLVVTAVVVGMQACGVDDPTRSDVPASSHQALHEIPEEIAREFTYTPFTVAPNILNRQEVMSALEREYPADLRRAGTVGKTRVQFLIDAGGEVRDVRLDEVSGDPAVDEAALRVARVFEFSPAKNQGEPVPMWISLPIWFQP